jgi:hypothetical protein
MKCIKTTIHHRYGPIAIDIKVGDPEKVVYDLYAETPLDSGSLIICNSKGKSTFGCFHFSYVSCTNKKAFYETKCICITVDEGFVVSISKHKPCKLHTKCRKDFAKALKTYGC